MMIPDIYKSPAPDLWAGLCHEKRPILLYGMGNGADKILSVLEALGIRVAGVFASDGFAKAKLFHGMPVISTTAMRERYAAGECVVLLSFGTSRPEVLELIEKVAADYPLLVPDVPVCGDALFDADFVKAHSDELIHARTLFADQASVNLFDAIVAAKLYGRLDLIRGAVTDYEEAMRLLSPESIRSMADLGAYNGDTVREMMALSPLAFALAMEPDARNFKKLTTFAADCQGCVVECHNAAAGDVCGSVILDASGNRNAGVFTGDMTAIHGLEKRQRSVPLCTLDSLLGGRAVDLIKFDVEGAESAALRGAVATIAEHAPRLRVACYHRSEDIFALPLLVHALAPRHRLYLRRRDGLPLWDIDLVALPPNISDKTLQ